MKKEAFITDGELVLAYQRRKDNQALSTLYNRYYDKLFRYCYSMLTDRESALDMTQEVFLKAAQHLDRLKNPVTFPSWLFRIAHNECIDHCREKGKTTAFPDVLQDQLSDRNEDREQLQDRERLFDAMNLLMEELGEDARTMLQLKYLQQYSIQDLQKKYQLSESAVKMRLSRARHRIERLYHQQLSER